MAGLPPKNNKTNLFGRLQTNVIKEPLLPLSVWLGDIIGGTLGPLPQNKRLPVKAPYMSWKRASNWQSLMIKTSQKGNIARTFPKRNQSS